MNDTSTLSAPDLTKRPPRSVRCRLGGIMILPRMLDKGRAVLAGTNGEFHYDCPLDKHVINFLGFDPEALKEQLATGMGDGEILGWLMANSKHPRSPWEIQQWTSYMETRGPDSDAETLSFFAEVVAKMTTTREDIKGWSDVLDLDDYVTFGGKV